MIGVLTKEREETHRESHVKTEAGTGVDAPISQGMPRIADLHQKLGERGMEPILSQSP